MKGLPTKNWPARLKNVSIKKERLRNGSELMETKET